MTLSFFERIKLIRAELMKRLKRTNMSGPRGHIMSKWLIEKRLQYHQLGDREGVQAVRYLQEFYIPEHDWSDDGDG